MMKTMLLTVSVTLLTLVIGSAPLPPAAASTRFLAFAASAQPLRLTPKTQALLTSEPVSEGVAMTAARIHTGRWEKDPLISLSIHNEDSKRAVKQLHFSFSIYDRSSRLRVEKRSLFKDVVIPVRKTVTVDLSVVTPLPADNLILLELTRVDFTDGSDWTTTVEHSLSTDFLKLEPKQKTSGQ